MLPPRMTIVFPYPDFAEFPGFLLPPTKSNIKSSILIIIIIFVAASPDITALRTVFEAAVLMIAAGVYPCWGGGHHNYLLESLASLLNLRLAKRADVSLWQLCHCCFYYAIYELLIDNNAKLENRRMSMSLRRRETFRDPSKLVLHCV
jgi:hypothetical protein